MKRESSEEGVLPRKGEVLPRCYVIGKEAPFD